MDGVPLSPLLLAKAGIATPCASGDRRGALMKRPKPAMPGSIPLVSSHLMMRPSSSAYQNGESIAAFERLVRVGCCAWFRRQHEREGRWLSRLKGLLPPRQYKTRHRIARSCSLSEISPGSSWFPIEVKSFIHSLPSPDFALKGPGYLHRDFQG